MVDISVIVPLYRTERFVEKCVRSVMDQTYRDIEIICVDDASPDGSAKIIERLMEEDGRISLVRHNENKGLGGARNTGIAAASAPYLASVDSDDYVEPEFLERLVEGTLGGKFDVVVCGFDRVDQGGRVISEHLRHQAQLMPIDRSKSLFNLSNPAFWNKLWRKSLFVDNGIFFPEKAYSQDQATTARIYARANGINFIGGGLYKYLVREDSITNRMSDKHLIDRFRVLDTLKADFSENGLFPVQRPFFEQVLQGTFRYHAENVLANNSQDAPHIQQYLKYMVLLRQAYEDFDDRLRDLSASQLFDLLDSPASVVSETLKTSRWARIPRVLVLTLHSGENEFEACKASVKGQNFPIIDHIIISGKGNVEAHRELYGHIMARRSEYDVFVKLDADMIFADDEVVSHIVEMFASTSNLDHIVFGCSDFMTGTQMWGVHAFTNRVSWPPARDGLFVDPNPDRPGERIEQLWPARTLVLHSNDPSPLQAFHFGAHRALKLVQSDRPADERNITQAQTQWRVLRNTWRQYKRNGDRRFGLALYAAHMVLTGEIGLGAHDYNDPSLHKVFASASLLTDDQLRTFAKRRWGSNVARWAYLCSMLGIRGAGPIIARKR